MCRLEAAEERRCPFAPSRARHQRDAEAQREGGGNILAPAYFHAYWWAEGPCNTQHDGYLLGGCPLPGVTKVTDILRAA
jgi:hypothetical protein